MPRLNARLLLRGLEDRITPMAGQLDATFGVGGLVKTRFPSPSHDFGQSLAVDSLGRIVIAGYTSSGFNDFAVTRYTPAGALDTSFGGTGIVTVAFGTSKDEAFSVAVDASDRVVVAGRAGGINYEFAVARLTTAGALDTSFDVDGKLTIAFTTASAEAHAVAIDSAGRIVVVGNTYDGTSRDFAVARLATDGALDTTFDLDGKLVVDFGSPSDVANAVAFDSLNRIVVAGTTNTGSNGNFAVARLTTTGALDIDFDVDGKQTMDLGGIDDIANAIAIDATDRIVVAGSFGGSGYTKFAVARLTSKGEADLSFAFTGTKTFTFNAIDNAHARDVAVDSMGRIVLAGQDSTSGDFALARLTEAGSFDSSFGPQGRRIIDFAGTSDDATAVLIDAMGRVVVAGTTDNGVNNDLAIARLASDGSFDSTFDVDGKQTTDLMANSYASAESIVVDGLGRILIAGYKEPPGRDFAVARYLPAGLLDTSFGNDGKVTIDFGMTYDSGYAIALDSVGRILVAGSSSGSGYFDVAVVRLTDAGTLDPTFGTVGKAKFNFGNSSYAFAIAVDSADRVLVAATAYVAGNTSDIGVARLTSAGVLDPTFDGDGKQLIDFAGFRDTGFGLAIDSIGHIVVAGGSGAESSRDFAVARLNGNGVLDDTFDNDGKKTFDVDGTDEGAYGVAIDTVGRIVLAGRGAYNGSGYNSAVARLTNTGALDTAFDDDGLVISAFGATFDRAQLVAIDEIDRIVISGNSLGKMAVYRLTSTGKLDSTFDSDGKQTITFGEPNAEANGIAFDIHERIIVVGFTGVNQEFIALARLTGDTLPLKLANITINDGSPQRSMVTSLKLTFDSKVSFTNAPASAFQLNRQGDDAQVTLSANVDVSGTFVTLTFTGGAVNFGGSLADGRYTLKILANQFSGLGFDGDGDGLAETSPIDDYVLVGNPANKLFRLFGDFDGDGATAVNDFIQFRLAFGGISSIFDFDNDGAVAANDFSQFCVRFGGSI